MCLVLPEEDEVEEAKRKGKARFWIYNIKGLTFGECHILFPYLTEYVERFVSFSVQCFYSEVRNHV